MSEMEHADIKTTYVTVECPLYIYKEIQEFQRNAVEDGREVDSIELLMGACLVYGWENMIKKNCKNGVFQPDDEK